MTLRTAQFNRSDQFDSTTPPRDPSPFSKWPSKQDDNLEWAGQKFRLVHPSKAMVVYGIAKGGNNPTLLTPSTRPPRSSDYSWTKSSSNKCRLCGKKYNLSCVMALLPDRETCEKLCGLFFATVFPLMPILHVQGFAEDLKTFWDGIRPGNLHDTEPGPIMRKKPSFVCLLSAILFAALSSASLSRIKRIFGDETDLNSGDIYFIAMVSATLTGFPRHPSIYSLAAYIIAQSQFVREEEFSDAPDFISTSFRIALGMGLHRQLPEAGFTAAELETRRRLWWYILHLDVMSSCSSGLSPLFIDEKMTNTPSICQYDAQEGDLGIEPPESRTTHKGANV